MRSPSHATRRPRLGAVLALAVSASALLPIAGAQGQVPHTRSVAAPASTTRKAHVQTVKVSPRLFGVHDAHLTSLSHTSTGSIRLWDTGTTWAQMQPDNGPPDFGRLDQVVNAAHAHGTEVTLVVAMTPSWAAADPDHSAPTDMPNLEDFESYLHDVMARYKDWFGPGQRGIANYQIWNEANIGTFWTGSQAQMTQLVQAASQVRQEVDPGARLVGPSMVARLAYQQKWIQQFYALKVGGKPVWTYVDALGFSLYPLDTAPAGSKTRPATPEDSMALLRLVKGMLAQDKVPASMPLWDSEVNYGLHTGALGGTPATPIPAARQVAYVMRTYLLNAAAGIQRVFWYAYDMGQLPGGGTLGNTLFTSSADLAAGKLTPAGNAFTRIQSWMAGTLVGTTKKAPCIQAKNGTYTCVVKYHKGMGRIYWNPTKAVKVTLVKSAKKRVDEYGHTTSVKGGKKIKVTYAPVLVRSTH